MPRRILIVDHDDARRAALERTLRGAYFETIAAPSTAAALSLAPSACLTLMEAPASPGAAAAQAADLTAAAPDAPVILVGPASSRTAMIAALEAGAADFAERPTDDGALLNRVRVQLRAADLERELRRRLESAAELGLAAEITADERDAPPPRVVLVAPRSDRSEALRAALTVHFNARCELAETGFAALSAADRAPPDLFLVADADAAPGGGFAEAAEDPLTLAQALRGRHENRDAPVIMLAAQNEATAPLRATAAFGAGATDYIGGDDAPEVIAARLGPHLRRKRIVDDLRARLQDGLKAAAVDAVTGLATRRYCDIHFARMFEQTKAMAAPFAAMMFDLDRFKAVNDDYGHAAGDEALAAVAKRLSAEVRAGDLVARYGGEEFLVAMAGVDEARAMAVAERIRAAVAASPVIAGCGARISLTVSVGVAVVTPGEAAMDPLTLIARADAALLQAKALGRDQVRKIA